MNPHRVLGAIFSAGAALTLLAGTAFAQLDTRFGTNGVVRIPVENGFSNAYAAAVQPDGKVVLAGQGNPSSYYDHDFLVARLNADGTPDRSFGTGGKVTRGVRSEDAFYAVAVQSDGKIVAAGTSDDVQICGVAPTGGCGEGRLVVMRFLPDGTPDRAWGNDGFVEVAQLPRPHQDVIAKEISLLADGAVLVYGQTGYGPVVVRLLANGAVDATFGQSGYARPSYTPTDYGALFLGSLPGRGLLLERYAATGRWFSWWDPASGTETAFARPAAFSQCAATGSS